MAGVARRRRAPAEYAKALQHTRRRAMGLASAGDESGWQQDFEDGLRALGLSLPANARSRFDLYMAELLRWRARINLTGFRTPQAIARHGFLDSLACLPAVPAGGLRVVDIGSGAGLPGLPLALARPDLEVTLIEASRRRHSFLAYVCRTLGLSKVRCLHGRAEALARDPGLRGRFDAAFARAVRRLEGAAGLASPFLREGGVFISQAGALPAAPPAIPGYGAALAFPLPHEGEGDQRARGLLIYARGSYGKLHVKRQPLPLPWPGRGLCDMVPRAFPQGTS